MSKVVQCDSCGAAMRPTADGRVYVCEYCRSQKQVGIDGAQLAHGLRLDTTNVSQFLHDLSSALHQAMPDKTRIQHEGGRLSLFELNLDPHVFLAMRQPTGVYVAQYKKLVRGVALKTKTLSIDVWVNDLTHSIASHANDNARVAGVLSRLKGG
ncbi:MAG: hypothetical protein U0234_27630 [Sandaracinus sp.]